MVESRDSELLMMYQYPITVIGKKLIALVGSQGTFLLVVVFREEQGADLLGSLVVNAEAREGLHC